MCYQSIDGCDGCMDRVYLTAGAGVRRERVTSELSRSDIQRTDTLSLAHSPSKFRIHVTTEIADGCMTLRIAMYTKETDRMI